MTGVDRHGRVHIADPDRPAPPAGGRAKALCGRRIRLDEQPVQPAVTPMCTTCLGRRLLTGRTRWTARTPR